LSYLLEPTFHILALDVLFRVVNHDHDVLLLRAVDVHYAKGKTLSVAREDYLQYEACIPLAVTGDMIDSEEGTPTINS
jgi:hypothetical protein